jgi:hypothetical protein
VLSTNWIEPTALYERARVGEEWGLTPAEMRQLIECGALRPIPLNRTRRPVFLGQELLDAVARKLQPKEGRP